MDDQDRDGIKAVLLELVDTMRVIRERFEAVEKRVAELEAKSNVHLR